MNYKVKRLDRFSKISMRASQNGLALMQPRLKRRVLNQGRWRLPFYTESIPAHEFENWLRPASSSFHACGPGRRPRAPAGPARRLRPGNPRRASLETNHTTKPDRFLTRFCFHCLEKTGLKCRASNNDARRLLCSPNAKAQRQSNAKSRSLAR